MIDIVYINAVDATKEKKTNVEIYAGQPVALDADGKLIPATKDTKVYGIAKLDSNKYKDVAWGEVGAYGTGRLAVILDGIIRVKASEFGKIEILPTGPLSENVVVKIFDDTKTYNVGDVLYVDSNGLITNDPVNKISIFGRVVRPVDALGWLEIQISPIIATSVSELAS